MWQLLKYKSLGNVQLKTHKRLKGEWIREYLHSFWPEKEKMLFLKHWHINAHLESSNGILKALSIWTRERKLFPRASHRLEIASFYGTLRSLQKSKIGETLYHIPPRNEAKLPGIRGLAPKDGFEPYEEQLCYRQTLIYSIFILSCSQENYMQ